MMAMAESLRGELRYNEPMARHTSWRVGGSAACFFRPADVDDLAEYMRQLDPGEPVYWVGLGSNLLVRDGGLEGSVIAVHRALSGLVFEPEGRVLAGAGVPCARIARQSVRQGLAGGEFFAGIPGTLGGALAMNAGAFGGETWERVCEVQVMDRQGRLHWRQPGEYRIGYRTVAGPRDEWFVAARLRFETDADGEGRSRIREMLARRGATQPTGEPSCGSVFRNPPGDHAARLIEAAGLKGYAIGGARVSDKHANFIVNTGAARAADMEALITHVRDTVKARFDVLLEPEVQIVGRPA